MFFFQFFFCKKLLPFFIFSLSFFLCLFNLLTYLFLSFLPLLDHHFSLPHFLFLSLRHLFLSLSVPYPLTAHFSVFSTSLLLLSHHFSLYSPFLFLIFLNVKKRIVFGKNTFFIISISKHFCKREINSHMRGFTFFNILFCLSVERQS